MREYLTNPWITMCIVIITQTISLYFRTLNVIYVTERKIFLSVLTGNAIALTWLISTAVGVNSVMNLEWQPMLGHIVGGTIGTLLGFKTKKNGIKH